MRQDIRNLSESPGVRSASSWNPRRGAAPRFGHRARVLVKDALAVSVIVAIVMLIALFVRHAGASEPMAVYGPDMAAPSMLVVGFAAAGAMVVAALLRRAGVSQTTPSRRIARERTDEIDDVHDAGLDSFPASDPPSWSPLRVGAPTSGLGLGLSPV